jgi:hypothetical protein
MTDPHRATPEQWADQEKWARDDSLVGRVAEAIYSAPGTIPWKQSARAAIREVAAWFEETRDSPETAAVLRDEAQ